MFNLSKNSRKEYNTLHPDLRLIIDEALHLVDFSIIEGARTKDRQLELLESGMTKTLNSKHIPGEDGYSHAVDIFPYPNGDWKDLSRFTYYQGIFRGIAHRLYEEGKISHKIRNGVDWDGDGQIKDHKFFDGPHIELIKP